MRRLRRVCLTLDHLQMLLPALQGRERVKLLVHWNGLDQKPTFLPEDAKLVRFYVDPEMDVLVLVMESDQFPPVNAYDVPIGHGVTIWREFPPVDAPYPGTEEGAAAGQ